MDIATHPLALPRSINDTAPFHRWSQVFTAAELFGVTVGAETLVATGETLLTVVKLDQPS